MKKPWELNWPTRVNDDTPDFIEPEWDNDFKEGVDVLLRQKHLKDSLSKAAEEFGELNVRILQMINKPEKTVPYDFLEELVDAKMHLLLLMKTFRLDLYPEIIREKIDKMLSSEDFLHYKKLDDETKW